VIFFLNARTRTEGKVIGKKDRFCEELQCTFVQFLEVAHESIVGRCKCSCREIR
jgi:hypothetical protein